MPAATRAVHYLAEFTGEHWTDGRAGGARRRLRGQPESGGIAREPCRGEDPRGGQKIAAARKREIDLKEIVTHLAVEGPGKVAFSLRADPSGSARPSEVLAAVFGDGAGAPEGVTILKEGVSIARTNAAHGNGQPRAPRYTDA